MKKPRIEDFDPNAVRPLASPLDNYPRIEKPPARTDPSQPANQENAKQEQAAPLEQTPSLPQDGDTMVSRYHDTMIPSNHDTTVSRHHDTTVSSNHDTMTPRYHGDIFEAIQKAVKQLGKKAATHRFTEEEKRALARIEFDFEDKKIQTTENELTRIAINFLIEDYQRNGDQSVVAKVLEKLHK